MNENYEYFFFFLVTGKEGLPSDSGERGQGGEESNRPPYTLVLLLLVLPHL